MNTIKSPGYHCPKCGAKPAEFKRMDEPHARWACTCGAGGPLTHGPAPAPKPKPVHPHWTQRKA